MINEELMTLLLSHFGGQIQRGLPILFTGAGFSIDCKNRSGEQIASGRKVREELWKLCFPDMPFNEGSSLSDLYSFAHVRRPTQLTSILGNLLTVDADSIPDYYQLFFSVPWQRVYTLNIDDIAVAVSRRFTLPRPTLVISATNPQSGGDKRGSSSQKLEVIHLNGTLEDLPDKVTFSPTQYAERLARPDPWYIAFVASLLSHSVVFVGTRLEESPLWQHIEMRQMRGGRGMQELRPRSYLVTPELDPAKQALLADYNVVWVPATGEEFASNVIAKLQGAAAAGQLILQKRQRSDGTTILSIPLVSELAINPLQNSDFLLGEEPIWSDIQSGRAISRDHDAEIWNAIDSSIKSPVPGVVVITGTAGSGKSTALLRACLRLVAEGKHVGWIDKDSDLSPRDIRAGVRCDQCPDIIAIDDADMFGHELSNLIHDITCTSPKSPLVILGIRSGQVERTIDSSIQAEVPYLEIAVPHLTDNDIKALLEILDRENRLGQLRGRSRQEQENTLRNYAGRQLLIAMLSATSGQSFREKPIVEFNELSQESRFVYALVAVSTAFRFSLSRDEVMMAIGDRSNSALNALEMLARRHIITIRQDGTARARHRVIADLILDELQKTGELRDVLEGLAFVAATRVYPGLRRNAKPWRLLRAVLNHKFLMRTILREAAQNLYSSLESLLSWDYHYWLQRGSLEVEFGSITLAENFLGQSRGLAQDDPYVATEWAYLQFRKAIDNVQATDSSVLVEEATEILEELIERQGVSDPYPYHVLGSQGLSWSRRSIMTRQEREHFLTRILRHLNRAVSLFPRRPEVAQLQSDVKRDYLLITVESQRSLI
jgi:hypothetical protein